MAKLYADIDNDVIVENMALSVDFSPINDAVLEVSFGRKDLTGVITDASNVSPIVITSAAHGLSNGDSVLIARVKGNRAANGGFVITVIDADTFSLDDSVGSGAYIEGGVWYQAPAGGVAIPLDYVIGSTGNYRGTVSGDVDFVVGKSYVRLIDCKNYRVRRGLTTVTCEEPQ